MVVNSLITNLTPGQDVPVGGAFEVKGVAWDGGRGITAVDVSADGGRSWRSATLGTDYGRFSWRSFSQSFTPTERGTLIVMARASNRAGATQTTELIFNPAGYHHNVMQRININAVQGEALDESDSSICAVRARADRGPRARAGAAHRAQRRAGTRAARGQLRLVP
ncbi:MAG TPA: hypothetical protein VF814_17295 [Casimicrobiaceae bacterium]